MLQELKEEKGQTQSLYILSPLVSAFCAARTNDHRLSHVEHAIFIISHFCWSQVDVGSAGLSAPSFTRPKSSCQLAGVSSGILWRICFQTHSGAGDSVPCSWRMEVSVSSPAVGWEPFSASMGRCIPWLMTFFLHQGFLISPSSLSATSFWLCLPGPSAGHSSLRFRVISICSFEPAHLRP